MSEWILAIMKSRMIYMCLIEGREYRNIKKEKTLRLMS